MLVMFPNDDDAEVIVPDAKLVDVLVVTYSYARGVVKVN